MGLFDRLFGGSDRGTPSESPRRGEQPDEATVAVRHVHGTGGFDVAAVGESNYQRALWRAVGGRSRDRVRHKVTAMLVPEVDNRFDSNAVAVIVVNLDSGAADLRDKVAYLSSEDAADYQPVLLELRAAEGCLAACDAVIVGGGENDDGSRRSLGIWLDLADPDDLLDDEPPTRGPVTTDERDTGTRTTGRLESGFFDGRHYTDYVEEVKQLKRDDRLDEAAVLLLNLIGAVEAEAAESTLGVAPWYYEQLAIVLRKQGDLDGEVSVLERFAGQPHAPGSSPPKLLDRLEKARAKRDRKLADK